ARAALAGASGWLSLRFLLLLLAKELVGPVGLLDADESVAVGVDAAKLRVGAEELAARNIAVVVAVHLAEPKGAGSPLGQFRPTHGHTANGHRPLRGRIAL